MLTIVPSLEVDFTCAKLTFVAGKNYPEIGINITLGFFLFAKKNSENFYTLNSRMYLDSDMMSNSGKIYLD